MGSEMCIRDRARAGPEDVREVLKGQHGIATRLGNQSNPPPSFARSNRTNPNPNPNPTSRLDLMYTFDPTGTTKWWSWSGMYFTIVVKWEQRS